MPEIEPLKDFTLDSVGTAVLPLGVGMVVSQPNNPAGWILTAFGALLLFYKYERKSKPRDQ